MAIIPANDRPRPVLDLRGPDGNAFVIIGTARRLARELGEDDAAVSKEMMALNDYARIVAYFEARYGAFVDIILPEGMDTSEVLGPPPIEF